MHVVVYIEGRKAVPVRAVLLATVGNVTPQGLTLELAKPDSERSLTAYRYSQNKAVPVRVDAWGMQHEILTGIVRGFKSAEQELENPERDQHRDAAWRKSLEALPAGVFVWLDELEKWYGSTRYCSPHSDWEELARVVGEDDDPEPQFQPKSPVLDLFPIAMTDCEDLVLQGFESRAAPPFATPAPVDATQIDAVATSIDGTASNQGQTAPKFHMTRSAMIDAHEHEWPSIRADLTAAAENGLAAAKAGPRGWHEELCMDWARAKNKLSKSETPTNTLAQAMHRIADLPGKKHTL